MEAKKLVILGSVNADHILNVAHFPLPGETISGNQFQMVFGGKGANQAVAAGRCGANISFLACLGNDDIGKKAKAQLMTDNIDTKSIELIDDVATGVALIFVNQQGENVIGIHAGANGRLDTSYVQRHGNIIKEADALLMQLESPLDSVLKAAEIAKQENVQVILNPAPAQALPDELLSLVDIITPNETETEYLTGIKVIDDESAQQAADVLHHKGIKTVLITLGSRGVWVSEKNNKGCIVPAFKVKAVDTIAAGDTFNGALITALLEGQSMMLAIKFAHAAAAIAVTRAGAQPSVPWRHEVDTFLASSL
ncbi:ribokinase [Proteus cibarius]|uniref:Ribokinase n=2 Tax=Proteus TaxID=583 RepID=A0A8I1BNA3_9GAMM|nr:MULTISPECIES: ribokinase [Proteus]MBG2915946.1 ribokinase [Proteus terrae subsp. cibarius]MBG3090445.1 ribokinase [Proteus terrae subsp. cibarius]MBG6039513.1 ribokinase [Proteus terrae subsp. cibarius]MCM2368891.1 ribokinase [Proteus sp. FZP2095]MCO4180973.1 ribokinase [Proteus terrae]